MKVLVAAACLFALGAICTSRVNAASESVYDPGAVSEAKVYAAYDMPYELEQKPSQIDEYDDDDEERPRDPFIPEDTLDDGLSGGQIAGICIGVIGGVALIAGGSWFFFVKRKKKRRRRTRKNNVDCVSESGSEYECPSDGEDAEDPVERTMARDGKAGFSTFDEPQNLIKCGLPCIRPRAVDEDDIQ
eukprot:CAMPEP_0184748894 /NCGR_PEP_ID=MMETSP0315-20130426/23647_1 /TAXON_ID=101924 /ORGANISM="Rhodosorus marinus, Strain UTEX LB 2760" /LENGTH=187 /DNA_ID=CAMNT_0027224993 /DNA_START=10 /DNA_END=573 /DNA_ORIENTATION=+